MIGWDYKRSGSEVEQGHEAYFSSNRTEKKGKIRKIIDNKVISIDNRFRRVLTSKCLKKFIEAFKRQ